MGFTTYQLDTMVSRPRQQNAWSISGRKRCGWLSVQEIRLNRFAKFAFGMGGIANGVKLAGLSTFLMLFYNQVLGLKPEVVASVIMITLVFDAAFDPLICYWSDNVRSRWGRRHPFMYASALPYPLLFLALWNPPDLTHSELAIYLLVVLILLRFFDTEPPRLSRRQFCLSHATISRVSMAA